MEGTPEKPISQQAVGQSPEFATALAGAIRSREELVSASEIKELKNAFRILHASFRTVYNILLRKGLVQEDPYKNDKKISEVAAPSNAPFLESERDTQMGIRLSDYDSQLDFLTSYYQFSIEFLNLARLRDLAGLTNYIRWTALTQTSENMTSRVLAELVEKVKKGGDQMSTSLLNDAQEQLANVQRRIVAMIKTISELQRERYKLMLRQEIVSRLPPEAQRSEPDSEEALRPVKKQFLRIAGGQPFYPELAREVLLEDRGRDAEERRSALLTALRVEQQKKKKAKDANPLRQPLLEAVRSLSGVSRTLEQSVDKLEENRKVMEERKLGFFERIRRWALKAVQRSRPSQQIEVEYIDITTKARQTELIDFQAFCESVRQKSRVFANTLSRATGISQKLETATDDQLLSFFSRNIADLRLIHRRLDSIDNYFKAAVTGDEASRIRGIKVELTSLKNEIIRANQKRHEFVSRREEAEQLKRLGVDVGE